MKGQYEDLTGKTFGSLKVLGRPASRSGYRPFWVCQCRCGRLKNIRADRLKSGNTRTCGCRNQLPGWAHAPSDINQFHPLPHLNFGRLAALFQEFSND